MKLVLAAYPELDDEAAELAACSANVTLKLTKESHWNYDRVSI